MYILINSPIEFLNLGFYSEERKLLGNDFLSIYEIDRMRCIFIEFPERTERQRRWYRSEIFQRGLLAADLGINSYFSHYFSTTDLAKFV